MFSGAVDPRGEYSNAIKADFFEKALDVDSNKLTLLVVLLIASSTLVVAVVRAGRLRRLAPHQMAAFMLAAITLPPAIFIFDSITTIGDTLGFSPSSLVLITLIPAVVLLVFQITTKIENVNQKFSKIESRLALAEMESFWPSHQGPEERTEGSLRTSAGATSNEEYSRNKCLILIPALNEAATVAGPIRAFREAGLPVLVVDDGSSDATYSVALSSGAWVVSHQVNLGVGAALRTGLLFAQRHGFANVAQCDADGQHPPDEVLRLLSNHLWKSYSLSIGVRQFGVDFRTTRLKGLVIRILSFLASRTGEIQFSDPTSGMRVFSADMIESLSDLMPDYWLGDTFEVCLAANRANYPIQEVEVRMMERQGGKPSMSIPRSVLAVVRAVFLVMFKSGLKLPQKRARKSS